MSDLRELLRIEVQTTSAAAVSRRLKVSRNTLLSYLAGTCREGTELVILQRVTAAQLAAPSRAA